MNIGITYKDINSNNATVLKTGVDLIRDELTLLLNMPKHSLFFGNNIGIDLERYLYLRNRKAVYHLIRDDIIDTLNKYGKVVLERLSIVFRETSTLEILLHVIVRATRETIVIPIVVQ